MSAENPQNKNFAISKNFATAQDVFGAIAFILAVIQGITAVIPAKSFLVIAGVMGYRTKRVGFIGDGASKLLLPSPF